MRDSCITKAAAVTPSDSIDLPEGGIGVYVGESGNLKMTTLDGDVVTLVALAAGFWHPIQAKRIWATDTTALSILVGW